MELAEKPIHLIGSVAGGGAGGLNIVPIAAEASAERRRKTYFRGAMIETPIFFSDQLDPGTVIEGPAIIEESTSTLVSNPGANARENAGGRHVLTPPEESEI